MLITIMVPDDNDSLALALRDVPQFIAHCVRADGLIKSLPAETLIAITEDVRVSKAVTELQAAVKLLKGYDL